MRLSLSVVAVFFVLMSLHSVGTGAAQYGDNPFVITLAVTAPESSAGGVIAAELTGDGRMDYLVTVPGHVAAYDHDGGQLWHHEVDVCVGGSSEREGLPGHHGPGVQAADVDGDGAAEVLYLTRDRVLHVITGSNGGEAWTASPPHPEGSARWEHLVVANFRGKGDVDLLLQATNKDGYRTGRYLAAYRIGALKKGKYMPLWTSDNFMACAHNGARVADLDGDGKDEVLGGTILGPDGARKAGIPLKGHIDSIFVADVRPDDPGLEVVALEEGGGNRVFLFDESKVFWESHYEHTEPQNAAVGEFDTSRPGLEVWCRSRFAEHQKPFVFDATGKLIARYAMDDVAPKGWTASGVEVIWTIDWTGAEQQLAAAKERHTERDIGVFNPVTGAFVARFAAKANRLYTADVSGDAREEMVVFQGNTLRIYHNPEKNARPGRPSPWEQEHYRRSKTTYNYYSP